MTQEVAKMSVADVASRAADDDRPVALDEVDAARAALAAVDEAIEMDRQRLRERQDEKRDRRTELHAAIVRALRAGARVNAVAAAADLTREQVRRIARAGGIEAE